MGTPPIRKLLGFLNLGASNRTSVRAHAHAPPTYSEIFLGGGGEGRGRGERGGAHNLHRSVAIDSEVFLGGVVGVGGRREGGGAHNLHRPECASDGAGGPLIF